MTSCPCKAVVTEVDSDMTKIIKGFYNTVGVVLVGYTVTGFFNELTYHVISKGLDDTTYQLGNIFMYLYAIILTISLADRYAMHLCSHGQSN